MVYITGDTHGSFQRIEDFCYRMKTTKEDIMIILGDVGVNFSGGYRDELGKEYLELLPITVFGIHGNHERRPQTIPYEKIGKFTKSEIMELVPSLSKASVENSLTQLMKPARLILCNFGFERIKFL